MWWRHASHSNSLFSRSWMLTHAAVMAPVFELVVSKTIDRTLFLQSHISRSSIAASAIFGPVSISVTSVLCCKAGTPNNLTPPTPDKSIGSRSSLLKGPIQAGFTCPYYEKLHTSQCYI